MSSTSPDHHDQPFGYEKRDANLKVIGLVTAATALFVILSVIVVDNIFVLTKELSNCSLKLRAEPEEAKLKVKLSFKLRMKRILRFKKFCILTIKDFMNEKYLIEKNLDTRHLQELH